MSFSIARLVGLVALLTIAWPWVADAQEKRPNIVIIWGDDVGQSNISAYTMG